MNNQIPALLTGIYFPYCLLTLVCILVTGLMVFSGLSESLLIGSGVYIISIWLLTGFILSFWTDTYWYYILHWFLSVIAGLGYWFLCICLSGRFGKPYTGDGAMIMLLPIYLLPVALVASISIKTIIFLLKSF